VSRLRLWPMILSVDLFTTLGMIPPCAGLAAPRTGRRYAANSAARRLRVPVDRPGQRRGCASAWHSGCPHDGFACRLTAPDSAGAAPAPGTDHGARWGWVCGWGERQGEGVFFPLPPNRKPGFDLLFFNVFRGYFLTSIPATSS
jgi:hypothetical protein